ncbi:MAG: helix-turn-helix domain-containing protein [Thermoguttaceae bacterium]
MLVVKTLQFIRQHACHGISVQDVVNQIGIQRRTLERRFVKHFNKTIHEEIIETQLKYAAELLINSRLTIRSITKRVGLNSVSHFSSLFLKKFAEKPGDYRKKRLVTFVDLSDNTEY